MKQIQEDQELKEIETKSLITFQKYIYIYIFYGVIRAVPQLYFVSK